MVFCNPLSPRAVLSRMARNLFLSFSIGILANLPTLSFGVVVANFSAPTNTRFEGDPSFIGNPYDWSGVGRVSVSADGSTNKEWATLIGENYFMSANHFKPSTGDTITFASGNLPGSPTFNYTVAGGFGVAGTDLWIGYTEEAMNASLKRYNITNTPANTLTELGLSGSELFMNGDNITGGAGTLASTVVGTNEAESWLEEGSSSFSTPSVTINLPSAANFDQLITFRNIDGDTSNTFTTHEAQVQSGDSGSPLFKVSGGDLEIVGIAWAVATDVSGNFIDTTGPAGSTNDPLEERNLSFYSYPGSYESEIASAVALVPPSVIPEPSSTIFLSLGIAVLFRRNK